MCSTSETSCVGVRVQSFAESGESRLAEALAAFISVENAKALGHYWLGRPRRRTGPARKAKARAEARIGGWESAINRPGNRVPCSVSPSFVTCCACEAVGAKYVFCVGVCLGSVSSCCRCCSCRCSAARCGPLVSPPVLVSPLRLV